MAARYYPRNTLACILFYMGISLILSEFLYNGTLHRYFGSAYYIVGGIFSYIPMDIFIQKTLDFRVQHELYVIAAIVIFCLIGWVSGILFRHHNPNPARPRMQK